MLRRENIENITALTALQEGMLFHTLRAPDREAYVEQLGLSIKGPLDPGLFSAAWEHLCLRHEMLRSVFVHEKTPEPIRIVLKSVPSPVVMSQPGDREAMAKGDRGIMHLKDPVVPFRIRLVQEAEATWYVLWTFHHLLLDGWSMAVLQEELAAIYGALQENREPSLPPPPRFSAYLQWYETQKGEAFWKEYLQGFRTPTPLPLRDGAAEGFLRYETEKRLSEACTEDIRTCAARMGVSLSSLIRTAWGLVLGGIHGRRDAVFAATVSGRPPEVRDVDRMVGLFINAVPVRIFWQEGESAADLIRRVQKAEGEASLHHHASLAQIQAETAFGRELLDHIFVFENYPDATGNTGPWEVMESTLFEHTHYDFELQVFPESSLWFRVRCNARQHDPQDVNTLLDRLAQVLTLLVADEKTTADLLSGMKTGPATAVCVAATFTADPLFSVMEHWAGAFGLPIIIRSAPYHQLFQQLSDPASLVSTSAGPVFLCFRFEDLLNDQASAPGSGMGASVALADALADAVAGCRANGPFFLCLFPTKEPHIQKAQQHLVSRLGTDPGRIPLDLCLVPEASGVGPVWDPVQEAVSGIPFSDAFLSYAATRMARMLVAAMRPPFKVIALDFDNTLWSGICGEAGADGVRITPGHQAFHRFLKERAADGFLLVGLSKNHPEDAKAVFTTRGEMGLSLSDLVSWRINWEPKAENIRSLAKELNLGIDSFVFLDDSPAECAEMRTRCPEVLTLQVPEDSAFLPVFAERIWAFDRIRVTEEDRMRPALYKAERKREEEAGAVDRRTFLETLGLRVSVARMEEAHLPRTGQLTRRTNQFHLNPGRLSDAGVAELASDPRYLVFAIHVADRFGSYGHTGVLIAFGEGEGLTIENFLLSCRVMGRGVELAVFAAIRRYCEKNGIREVCFRFQVTDRNRPALDALNAIKGKQILNDGRHCLEVGVTALPDLPDWIELSDTHLARTTGTQEKGAVSPPSETKGAASPYDPACLVPENEETGTPLRFIQETVNQLQLTHRADLQPLLFGSRTDWEALLRPAVSLHRKQAVFSPVKEGTETLLAAIWEDLLGVREIGRNDDFFLLGGHSLLATRLVARIAKTFQVTIGLETVFSASRLQTLAKEVDAAAGRFVPIGVTGKKERSPAQERMLFLQKLSPETSAYNLPAAWRISGPVAVKALTEALKTLVARHDALRTRFPETFGVASPVEDLPDGFTPVFADLTSFGDPESAARERVDAFCAKGFDLACDLPIRVLLLRVEKECWVMVWVLHHIAADGQSFGILLREFTALYEGLRKGIVPDLPRPRIRFQDAANWLKAESENPASLSWWKETLKGPQDPLDLPTDFPRLPLRDPSGAMVTLPLGREAEEALTFLAAGKITPFAVLTAAVKALLFLDTGQNDIRVGTAVSGRQHPDTMDLVGFFANTLVLRDHVDAFSGFSDLVAQVSETVKGALAHPEFPFERLVQELDVVRDTARSPIFDVICVLQEVEEGDLLPGLTVTPFPLSATDTAYDLVFCFAKTKGGWQIAITYATALFAKERILRMAGHIRRILLHGAKETSVPVGKLRRLTGAEEATVLHHFNETRKERTPDVFIHTAFLRKAALWKDRIAMVSAGETITYGVLAEEAACFSLWLQKTHKTAPGDVVAVCAERSIAMVRALLGILMAGGVYLPVDTRTPRHRLVKQMTLSDCRLLLTDTDILSERKEERACVVAALEPDLSFLHDKELPDRIAGLSTGLSSDLDLAAPAYLIFTSGSTGEPKGVVNGHDGFLNMVEDQIRVFGVTQTDRVLWFASPGFDASLSEIFMALFAGATLIPADRETIARPDRFTAFLQEKEVGVATLPPVYLRQLRADALPLRVLITAGEAADPAAAREHAGHRRYFNAYGPTEYSVCTSIHEADPDGAYDMGVPIGKPIANTRVYILGPGGMPQPVGVAGELCVAGPGLAHGYLGRKALTDEKFVPDPFFGGERMYKTGDRAIWLSDGNIRYLGRGDDQVKIRGIRVEPGEVAALLCRYPAVRDAVAGVREIHGERELVAWVTGEDLPPVSFLARWLSDRVPEAMVPARMIVLEEMPLTGSGKIDRARLMIPRESAPRKEEAATKEEEGIRAACVAVLGEGIRLTDDLFFQGLNSLKAIRLLHLLEASGIRIPLMAIYRHRTIRNLADCIASDNAMSLPVITPLTEGEKRPIVFFPPMPGFGAVYRDIGLSLGDFSVYTPDFATPKTLAASVRAAMAERGETQDWIFAGYSGGGNLAVRVAGLMAEEGIPVRNLVLVDAWRRKAPVVMAETDRQEILNRYVDQFTEKEASSNDQEAVWKQADAYQRLLDGSRDPVPVSATIHLVTSEDPEPPGTDIPITRNWQPASTGGCICYPGSGPHDRMLEEPHLTKNVTLLHNIFAKI